VIGEIGGFVGSRNELGSDGVASFRDADGAT